MTTLDDHTQDERTPLIPNRLGKPRSAQESLNSNLHSTTTSTSSNRKPSAQSDNGSPRSRQEEEEPLVNDQGVEEQDSPPPPSSSSSTPFRKFLKFILIWGTISIVVLYCIVQAFRKGGGEFDWNGSLKKALGGGIAGGLSMIVQVLTLMPLRTIMNYQYRYGTTLHQAFTTLYHPTVPDQQGGIRRLYSGLIPALIQGPLSRFGDTASNAGVLALFKSNPFLNKLPTGLKTAAASFVGACFRLVLMPVDTLKTTMQTESNGLGLKTLKERVKRDGPGTLWNGAWATAAANFVGSFPWFATYNYLSLHLPLPSSSPSHHSHLSFILLNLSRQAIIGFVSSVVSDTVSNSLRVLKTYRQVAREEVGYRQAAREIIAKEGLIGLFGRGLKTRYLANGLQGLLFSVLWKLFQDLLEEKK